MKELGIVPKHQVLENEISKSYKAEIRATRITYQVALPDNHCRNIVEKSIQMCKYHFVGVMSVTAATLPTHLWCQAVPQAERQILLLRQSNVTLPYQLMNMCMVPMTTTQNHFFPLEWKSSFTTSCSAEKHLPSTAAKFMSWAHLSSTIAPGSCG